MYRVLLFTIVYVSIYTKHENMTFSCTVFWTQTWTFTHNYLIQL